MLILTRRISESLIVGDRDLTFTVLGIQGNQVRIGIRANSNITVDREEIYLRKVKEKDMPSKKRKINTVRCNSISQASSTPSN